MTSRRFPSDGASPALRMLSDRVRDIVRKKGWPDLRDIQQKAVPIVKEGKKDLIVAAQTAGGKTEAAFLPILSVLDEMERGESAGVGAVYIGPLKALINDQARRLEEMASFIGLPVTPWHGDIGAKVKSSFLNQPSGILLITPESLEAFFVLRAERLKAVFSGLRYIVIDEIHSFVGQERGRQLQSQLTRLELLQQRRIPRIGLSATIGKMEIVQDFLRRGKESEVEIVEAEEGSRGQIRLKIRGYVRAGLNEYKSKDVSSEKKKRSLARKLDERDEQGDCSDEVDIARHLFKNLRGVDNLIFANSRTEVERLGDRLRRISDNERVPHEFFPHHGNLHRSLREDLEKRLKTRGAPVSAVCTTTLEMGIDIGDVASVAQVGAPNSVASFTQRLGRSGRRDGAVSVMRVYVTERELRPDLSLPDLLRLELVQATAVVGLMVSEVYEPPASGLLHLSTLVQQFLSLIAQVGSVTAVDGFRVLCLDGPFREVTKSQFADVLRSLASKELIQQTESGAIVIGLKGESLIGHYDFYAAFANSDEYTIRTEKKTLGTLPVGQGLEVDGLIVFAGRCWKIRDIDADRRVILVAPHDGGRIPRFDGRGPLVHDNVRREMERVLQATDSLSYLNPTASQFLTEARLAYFERDLRRSKIIEDGDDIHLLPFAGDLAVNTLMHAFSGAGVAESIMVNQGILTLSSCNRGSVQNLIREWARDGLPPNDLLATRAENLELQKHDRFLNDGLLRAEYSIRSLDRESATAAIERLSALK